MIAHLYDGPEALVKILVSAPLVYFAVVVLTRLSGKRSTSQMNSFDWVVTVALGSIVASGVMVDDISVTEAVLAVALLYLLQWMVTKAVRRWQLIHGLVKATPRLLYFRGSWCTDAMDEERVTRGEVLAAVRGEGIVDLDKVFAVVLETDAHLSVVPSKAVEPGASLGAFSGVQGDELPGDASAAESARTART